MGKTYSKLIVNGRKEMSSVIFCLNLIAPFCIAFVLYLFVIVKKHLSNLPNNRFISTHIKPYLMSELKVAIPQENQTPTFVHKAQLG